MILWRPDGLEEMRLIFDSGMRRFPPRLPEQPIFYPVLARSYAAEIAAGWNVRDAPHAGYVLHFEVDDDYISKFAVHVVGASVHRELWIPAEQLDEFNDHLHGSISADEAFFGSQFVGETPSQFLLAGKNAPEQIQTLVAILAYSPMDLHWNCRQTHAWCSFTTLSGRPRPALGSGLSPSNSQAVCRQSEKCGRGTHDQPLSSKERQRANNRLQPSTRDVMMTRAAAEAETLAGHGG